MNPGFKESALGVIPVDWDTRTIGETFELINGCAFKPSDWKRSGLPIIRIQNLNDPDAEFNYSQAPAAERNVVEPGDLLFAWSGTIGSSFGARLWPGPRGVLNQHIFKVLMDTSKISKGFALLVFARVEDDIAREAHGFKASFVHVKKSDLQKVDLPIPPIEEQRAIATALSDVDALIAGLEQLIAKKRDIKQATMQQLLTGQTRLPGFCGEWEVKRMGEIAEITMGRTPPRLNTAFWGHGHIWLSIADLHGKVVSESKEQITALAASTMTAVRKGTLLMSFKLSIGRLCFAGTDLYTNEAICAFNALKASAAFLYYALGRVDFSLYGKQAVKGYTLNKQSLALVEVSLPSIEEQTAIASVLSDIDADIAALEARLAKTRAIKQGMMQELLTGRTRLV